MCIGAAWAPPLFEWPESYSTPQLTPHGLLKAAQREGRQARGGDADDRARRRVENDSPAPASPQSRAARFGTLPIAAYSQRCSKPSPELASPCAMPMPGDVMPSFAQPRNRAKSVLQPIAMRTARSAGALPERSLKMIIMPSPAKCSSVPPNSSMVARASRGSAHSSSTSRVGAAV